MYTLAEENYLKAIYALWEKSQESVNTNAIADKLQTKAASVTDMVKKLSDKKMLKYEKYKGVMLTDKGMKIAVSVVRKHRLWEVFLHEKLNFGWDEVHEIAEQLEHIDSPLLIDRLEEFLGFPAFDPHGDVIPGKNGEVKVSNFQVLSEVKVGANVTMSGVVDHSPSFLQYLDKLDLSLGVIFQLTEKEIYDGSLVIKLNNKSLQLSKEVARNILVRIK